jgi:phytoene dehydrogenase-like protein
MAAATDAIVIGSGPNGLAAAITLAQAGLEVTVFEAAGRVGGGLCSAELTLPGFVHDLCSAVHPFARISPFFRALPLERYGLEWITPAAMLAHPFDEGAPAIVERSIETTGAGLEPDNAAYRTLMQPLVDAWPRLESAVLGPPAWPRYPFAVARFGVHAIRSARGFAMSRFGGARARGLFAGTAAHGMLPLDWTLTAAFGLVLGMTAHVAGWVFPQGGAQRLADALAAHLQSLGGRIVTSTAVASLDDLPPARAVLCDLSPRPFLRIAGHRLPPSYRRKLEAYRYGMGVFKVDWALDGPIPWRSEACARAGTVHLGGTLEEIDRAEQETWTGRHPERPFLLLAQHTLFDPSRAPAGKHTVWAYCHVPGGSTFDMRSRIEAQVERFAPGFRDRILARHVTRATDLEQHNPNYVGGDIAAGVTDLAQVIARPTLSWYSTPVRGLYMCSAATPPGIGVHGMCGFFAAQRALKEVFQRRP